MCFFRSAVSLRHAIGVVQLLFVLADLLTKPGHVYRIKDKQNGANGYRGVIA
ncbi:hypothetical protein KIN20_030619, partial [Parelaphostrongylus tenuis]